MCLPHRAFGMYNFLHECWAFFLLLLLASAQGPKKLGKEMLVLGRYLKNSEHSTFMKHIIPHHIPIRSIPFTRWSRHKQFLLLIFQLLSPDEPPGYCFILHLIPNPSSPRFSQPHHRVFVEPCFGFGPSFAPTIIFNFFALATSPVPPLELWRTRRSCVQIESIGRMAT